MRSGTLSVREAGRSCRPPSAQHSVSLLIDRYGRSDYDGARRRAFLRRPFPLRRPSRPRFVKPVGCWNAFGQITLSDTCPTAVPIGSATLVVLVILVGSLSVQDSRKRQNRRLFDG